MASADTLLSLEADEGAVVSFLDEHGGLVLRDADTPGSYWLVLRPKRDPCETYYAKAVWGAYPDQPPSIRFHDGVGGRFDVTQGWPQVAGYRVQGVWDICQPFTAEGFAAHPEWPASPHRWVSVGNPFLFVAQNLQNGLNQHYQGRHP